MPFSPRSKTTARIDPIAAGWGGLVGAIGLMVSADRGWFLQGALLAVAFLVGGYLAGVRAGGRRVAHGAASWVAAHLLHVAFIAAAAVIDLFGGPDPPALAPDGGNAWLYAAGWTLAWALLGAYGAQRSLTPAARRR